MHFTIDRKQLIKAIDFVSATVAVRTTKPAIEGIKISVVRKNEANLAVLESTDLEISSQYTLPTNALLPATEGACCVDPKQLVQILRTRENEVVELKLTDRGLNVATKGMDVDLQIQPAEDFPSVVTDEGSKLQIEAKTFADALKSVFCAENKTENSGRWTTAGIYFEEIGDAIDIVATTTRVLAWSSPKTPCGVNPPQGGVTVPRKAAHIIERKLRTSEDGQAEIVIGKSIIKVSTGPTVVVSKLLEGKFPPFRNIWPKVMAHSIELDITQLKRDMQAVAAIRHPEHDAVAKWIFEPGKMSINGSGLGSVAISNDIDCNFKVETKLDAKMFCDLIDARDGAATIRISNSKEPILIEQDGWKSLIMPLCD